MVGKDMMAPLAPWHRASYDRFLQQHLPQLLAERLPLAGYQVIPVGPCACMVRVAVRAADGEVEATYELPQPDGEGVFEVDGQRRVVVPLATEADLEHAEIRCVGEQLAGLARSRLGEAPADLPWEPSLLCAWVPLHDWLHEVLATAEPLDETNWLARQAHLRRIRLPENAPAVACGQMGLVCPFETPSEGPATGRVLSVAVGATIVDGRFVLVDGRPEATLGLTASMVPLLEHDDANRLIMGVDMMRQWQKPLAPEPALVQTGREPAEPGFWCGRNLLTAFIAWGGDTFEDGIVVSEGAARRLSNARPLEPGDKLSNRHGTKGVIGRILPEDAMPHLADGTPVDLVFDFVGLHARLNFGQLREAVLGHIAHAQGAAFVTPPFHAPDDAALHRLLAKAGLPEDGMEQLMAGAKGPKLEVRSTVGWVYWGRTVHDARDKMASCASGTGGMRQGVMESLALLRAGAFELVRDTFNTRALTRPDAASLAARVAAGPVPQAGAPTPALVELQRRLEVAGVRAEQTGAELAFHWQAPRDALKLARPQPHPWLSGRTLTEVGTCPDLPEFGRLVEANTRLQRLREKAAPAALAERAEAELAQAVRALFAALLPPRMMALSANVAFSGRAVLAPGPELHWDQAGVPDEMAWSLFGPLVVRALGDEQAVRARTERAAAALDRLMAENWVIVNRAPTVAPTSLLAFHAVRQPEPVLRLHPLACMLLDADFDGDMAALLLPITEAGQRDAGDKLTLAGHIARERALLWPPSGPDTGRYPLLSLAHYSPLLPRQGALWGLAWLSLSEEGRQCIAAAAGADLCEGTGPLDRGKLARAAARLADEQGIAGALGALERLSRLGFEAARASGASLSPFAGEDLALPPQPQGDDPDTWDGYAEQVAALLGADDDFTGELGPQLLAIRSGARGRVQQLALLLGAQGVARNGITPPVIVRHGLRAGLAAEEMLAVALGARAGLERMQRELEDLGWAVVGAERVNGWGVLARAKRASRPGLVFARAAAQNEVDPLTDVESRLFVGLPA